MVEITDALQHSAYTYLRLIGQGGMGQVHLAYHEKLKRHVAVKHLHPTQSEEQRQRLQREAASLAQLNHPHVVQVYDFIDDGHTQAIVMEYVDGHNLKQHLRENVVSLKQKLKWLIEITSGLAAAHEKGLIHRDLKAENILIGENGQAKITDFGIVKDTHDTLSEATCSGELLGSFSSVSPEQALGKVVNEKSDLFSLGILAYRLIYNTHPFGDQNQAFVLVQHIINSPPFDPKTIDPNSNAALNQLIYALLEKSPDDRPASASTVQSILQGILPSIGSDTADDMTQTLSGSLSSGTETKIVKPRLDTFFNRITKRIVITLSAALCTLGLLVYAYTQLSNPAQQRYVALLPTIVDSDTSSETQTLLLEAIELTLQNSIIKTQNLHLISPQDVKNTRGDYAEKAKTLAADVVIESTLSCNQARCTIGLHRLEPSASLQKKTGNPIWILKTQREWTTLLDSQFLNSAYDLEKQFYELFPKNKSNNTSVKTLSADDYAWFLKARHTVLTDQIQYQDYWEALTSRERTYRDYPPYYDLLQTLANELYIESTSKEYLTTFSSILTSANSSLELNTQYLDHLFFIALENLDYKKCDAILAAIKKTSNDKARIYSLEGTLLKRKGLYSQATARYKSVYSLRPTPYNLYKIAFSYWSAGDSANALKNLEKIIVELPNDSSALNLLGLIHLMEGNFRDAINTYSVIIKHAPLAQHYNNLGLAHEFLGNYREAKSAFSEAVRLAPNNPIHILNLADSDNLMNNSANAAINYNKVVSLTANEPERWEYMTINAQSHAHLNNTENALKSLHLSLRLAPDNPEVLYSAALVYSLTKQHAASLSYIQQGITNGVPASWFLLPWFQKTCLSNPIHFFNLLPAIKDRAC